MSLPVSVVVVNHNGRDCLEACLGSILREEPAEILLVDSGSTDGAAEEAARRHPLRLLTLGENRGPSAARNFGLREASHEVVLLVDNDVELRPGCLQVLLGYLEARPDLALIQARSLLGSADGPVHYDGGCFHFLGLIALRNWYRPQAEAAGQGLVDVDVAISLCCIGRRDVLLELGGFDEEMFILFEDLAISYALKLAGHGVAVAEDATCIHKGGTRGLSTRGESRSYSGQRTFLHSRNRWIFLLTHYRWRTLLVLSPGFLLYGLMHVGFAGVSLHLGAWLRGKAALWRLRGYLRRRRRRIQAARRRRDRELLGCPELTFNPGLARGGVRGIGRRALAGGLRVIYAGLGWLL